MSAAAAGVMMTLFHWEKLSPAEFLQLQEYALCELPDGYNEVVNEHGNNILMTYCNRYKYD